jgi:hypothetical protein
MSVIHTQSQEEFTVPWMQSYPAELDDISLNSDMDDNPNSDSDDMPAWRQRIYLFMSKKESTASRWFYFLTVFVILVSVVTLSLSTVPEYTEGEPKYIIYIVEAICIAFFSIGNSALFFNLCRAIFKPRQSSSYLEYSYHLVPH